RHAKPLKQKNTHVATSEEPTIIRFNMKQRRNVTVKLFKLDRLPNAKPITTNSTIKIYERTAHRVEHANKHKTPCSATVQTIKDMPMAWISSSLARPSD